MRKKLVNQQSLTWKVLQFSLLCAMMLVPIGAWAQQFPNGGEGTEESPYLINTPEDLVSFATMVNEGTFTDKYVSVNQDIDCSDLDNYVPIGNSDHPFIGHFNGGGNKITGLSYIAGGAQTYAGLFQVIGVHEGASGHVSNLVLENCAFGGGENNGAIAAYMNNGIIENCTVISCTINTSGGVSSPMNGGIVGEAYSGTISNCHVNGCTITATTTTADGVPFTGGIVGDTNGAVTISGCEVTGTEQKPTTISSTHNESFAGGIVGVCEGTITSATITGCSVKGYTTVSAEDQSYTSAYAGAIVGSGGNATFTNNYYYYSVMATAKTHDETNNTTITTEKKEYETRGTGSEVSDNCYDIIADNGAVLYTKKLTLAGNYFNIEGLVCYEPLSDNENKEFYCAPGQTVAFPIYPEGYVPTVSVTYTLPDAAAPTTIYPENVAQQGDYEYSFEMPDADATFNVGIEGYLNLIVRDVPVTSANASNITGYGITPQLDNGSVSFNPETNTLTLNNVNIYTESSEPIVVSSLANLTVNLVGESLFNFNDVTPTYVFQSTNENAVLKFVTKDDNAQLTIPAAEGAEGFAEGFANVAYENNLVYLASNNTISKVYLAIGEHVVTGDNSNVLGEETTPTVSFDAKSFTLTLDGATIEGATAAQNITVCSPVLNVKIKGTNTLHGGFEYTGQGKCNLIFITDAATAQLTMNEAISDDQFNVIYRNSLSQTGLVISLPTDYGITIAGTAVMPANRLDVLNDGKISFNSNNLLILDGATIDGEIVMDATAQLPESGLTIYLAGNNTITNNTGHAIKFTGTGSKKLTFIGGDDAAKLVYTNSVAVPTEADAFSGFEVSYGNTLTSEVNSTDKTITIKPALNLIVDEANETAQTDYGTEMTLSTNTNNKVVDGLLYTTGDDTGENKGTTSGYDQDLKKFVFTPSGTMDQGAVDASADKKLGTNEYAAAFTGITGMLPAGQNTIELLEPEIADGYDLFVKIGSQGPIAVRQLIQTIGTQKLARIVASIGAPSLMQIYLRSIGTSAPAIMAGHRIGPKSSVAGALGGVKVTNNSMQSSSGPATTYKTMELATMAAAITSVGDALSGYSCSDPDITDLPDDMFLTDGGMSPAPRRAAAKVSILPEGLTFVDFSGTKITGMEVSRSKGAFNGVPENVFIYMPAGNTTKEKNVVIGDICDNVLLNGEKNAQPFKAKKDFKAGQATLKRSFDALSGEHRATIYLPYAISQEDADKLGKFYEYTGNDGMTVSMTQVTSGGLKANKPYIFEVKEGGVTDPMVRVVDVVANPAETDGFKGVYERKEYEDGMYCYAADENATESIVKGQFVQMGPRSYVPPFRAYMIGSGAPSYAIAWNGMFDDAESTTAIEDVKTVKTITDAKTREGWWTLNGIRMTEKAKKAGLYILNGKMVAVKK